MFSIFKNVRKCIPRSLKGPLTCLNYSDGSIYEPDYLEKMKPSVPQYDILNIELKGYDFPVLENYQKYLHKLIKSVDYNVEEAWAIPPKVTQVSKYKPQSELVDVKYTLNTYQRTLQVTDLSGNELSLLLRIINASAPVGVTVEIVKHENHHEEIRYIPDTQLGLLQQELEEMKKPKKK